MQNMSDCKQEKADSIKRRLRRIEGQLKGIERMLDEESCCMNILVQVAAVKAATARVGTLIIENHIHACLEKAMDGEQKEKKIEELISVLNNFIK